MQGKHVVVLTLISLNPKYTKRNTKPEKNPKPSNLTCVGLRGGLGIRV